MERFLGEDSIFVLVAAIFTLVMAVRAWRKGAMESIWSLASWGSGAGAGWWIYNHAPELLARYAEVNLHPGAAFVASVVMAIVTFAIVRKLAKTLLDRVFGPGTVLGGWMYGGTGSILSTLPSFALIVCIALSIRVSGTMMELNQIDRVTASREQWTAETYPDENLLARWRDAIEGLPKGELVLDFVDPVSTIPRRNLAAILLASFNPYLRTRLQEWPRTRQIANHRRVRELVERDLELNELIAGRSGDWKYFRLLRHPKLTEALQDDSLRRELSSLDASDEIRAILTGQPPRKRKRWLQRIFT